MIYIFCYIYVLNLFHSETQACLQWIPRRSVIQVGHQRNKIQPHLASCDGPQTMPWALETLVLNQYPQSATVNTRSIVVWASCHN